MHMRHLFHRSSIRYAAVAFLSAVLAMSAPRTEARPYDYSLGIRLGNCFAAEGKFFFSMSSAVDISFGLVNPFTPHHQFMLVTGAYNLHLSGNTSGLLPYIGAGISLGTEFGDRDKAMRTRKRFFMSADIPLGLDYKLPGSPVVFCLEWSPKIGFIDKVRFIPHSISVGFRYTFN